MTDLELAASTFVERFMDLVDLAKHEAATEFAAEKHQFEAKLTELRLAVLDAEARADRADKAALDAADALKSFKTALSGLVK